MRTILLICALLVFAVSVQAQVPWDNGAEHNYKITEDSITVIGGATDTSAAFYTGWAESFSAVLAICGKSSTCSSKADIVAQVSNDGDYWITADSLLASVDSTYGTTQKIAKKDFSAAVKPYRMTRILVRETNGTNDTAHVELNYILKE